MKWEDTVMEDPSNIEWTEEPRDKYAADFSFVDDYKYEVKRICESQAEISFKAGINLVVEWIGNHGGVMTFINMHHEDEWEAKLKEWGIDNE